MGYRNFRDASGTDWQAWDVIPRLVERRHLDRRRMQAPIGFPDRRRIGRDRRIDHRRRGVLSEGLEYGWLAFESSNDDRRRLTPIPPDWMRCSEEKLVEYCEQARQVRRSSSIHLEF